MFWKGRRQSWDIVPVFLLTSVSGKKSSHLVFLACLLFSLPFFFSHLSLKLTCEFKRAEHFGKDGGWRSSAVATDCGHHCPLDTRLPVNLYSFSFATIAESAWHFIF